MSAQLRALCCRRGSLNPCRHFLPHPFRRHDSGHRLLRDRHTADTPTLLLLFRSLEDIFFLLFSFSSQSSPHAAYGTQAITFTLSIDSALIKSKQSGKMQVSKCLRLPGATTRRRTARTTESKSMTYGKGKHKIPKKQFLSQVFCPKQIPTV